MPNGMSGPGNVSTAPEVPISGLTSAAGLVTSLGAEALVAAELVPAAATGVPRAVAAVTSAYSTRRGRLRVMGVPFLRCSCVWLCKQNSWIKHEITESRRGQRCQQLDMRQ